MFFLVGANDGQTIEIGLQEITSSSLGLNGFNVNGGGDYGVITNHDEAEFSDLVDNMQSGNTVTVGGTSAAATEYTFASEQKMIPTSGTNTGTFEVNSSGNVTLNGQAAYISAAGELTNNNDAGTATEATMGALLAAASTALRILLMIVAIWDLLIRFRQHRYLG